MRRREFLKAGSTPAAFPFIGSGASGQPQPEAEVAAAWKELVARAEDRTWLSELADRTCEQGLDLELNSPGDEQSWDSLEYLEHAARWGQAFAQWVLSTRYWEGWRAPIRREEAMALCHQAAESGDFMAQIELALRYGDGCGVSRNVERQEFWWDAAATLGALLTQAEIDLVEPRDTFGRNQGGRDECWRVYRRIIDVANRPWGRKKSANGGPRWHTMVPELMVDLARLKLRILRVKRLRNSVWRQSIDANGDGP